MTNIAQKTKTKTEYREHMDWYSSVERESWELSQEEIIEGLRLFENTHKICEEMGDGRYALEPFRERYLYLVFDPQEVIETYMRVYQVEWPKQVDRLSDEEMHAMFEDVREYLDVPYHSVFSEEKILTIHASKKLKI